MCGIYKITNVVNGKVYIGQALNIKNRFNDHKNDPFYPSSRGYHLPFYCAIRKYGIENLTFEVLEECLPFELDEKEIYYIAKFEAFGPKGYNLTTGGHSSSYIDLDDDVATSIIDRLKTTEDTYDIIAAKYGLKTSIIHHINNGRCCYRSTEKYPIEDLLESWQNITVFVSIVELKFFKVALVVIYVQAK